MQDMNAWAINQMAEIDREWSHDRENWHRQADSLLFHCLLTDLSDETKSKVANWFNRGTKWYA